MGENDTHVVKKKRPEQRRATPKNSALLRPADSRTGHQGASLTSCSLQRELATRQSSKIPSARSRRLTAALEYAARQSDTRCCEVPDAISHRRTAAARSCAMAARSKELALAQAQRLLRKTMTLPSGEYLKTKAPSLASSVCRTHDGASHLNGSLRSNVLPNQSIEGRANSYRRTGRSRFVDSSATPPSVAQAQPNREASAIQINVALRIVPRAI
jgi:hypothetical protein